MSEMDWTVPDNLGMPSRVLDTIFLLNDSTIVEISKTWGRAYRMVDTVVNHPICKMTMGVDSIKMRYPVDVVFIGFDGVPADCPPPLSCDSVKTKTENQPVGKEGNLKKIKEFAPSAITPDSGSPHGFSFPVGFQWTTELLLVVLGITTVGLIAFRFLHNKRVSA